MVLKNGGSSTLEVIKEIKALLPRIRSTLPPALNLTLLFDQSIFVRAAIQGVLREALIGRVSHRLDDPAFPGPGYNDGRLKLFKLCSKIPRLTKAPDMNNWR